MDSLAPGVCLQNISKSFGPHIEAVARLNLELPAGRFTALLGPTGCGKTTILRMIGGLETPDGGAIEFTPPSPAVGYCFQEPRLLPWRDVHANVALPLELARVDPTQRSEAVRRALELVGLSDAANRLPGALSGGMRMRTALARTLVPQPQLLLLDEPFGALDEVTRLQLEEELVGLTRDRYVTTVLVTHSITEAIFLADQVIVLSSRPAAVRKRFEIDFPVRDANLRTTSEFASLTGEVYAALREGMESGS